MRISSTYSVLQENVIPPSEGGMYQTTETNHDVRINIDKQVKNHIISQRDQNIYYQRNLDVKVNIEKEVKNPIITRRAYIIKTITM